MATTPQVVPSAMQESVEIVLKRLEYEYQVAQRGLFGLLIAVVVGLVIIGTIVILAMLLPLFATRDTIGLTGAQLVVIVIALLSTIAVTSFLYGAFIYKRLAKFEADLAKRRGGAEIG